MASSAAPTSSSQEPFGVAELTARIGALARRARRARTPASAPPPRSRCAVRGIGLDPVKHTARVRQADVLLTPHEFELLYQLASQPGVVFSAKICWRPCGAGRHL